MFSSNRFVHLELINRRHQTNQIVPIHQPSEVEFRLTKAEECLRERDLHIDKLTKQLENLQTKKIPSTSLKRDIETMKILRADLQKKTDQLDKLRALYDAVNVQHKSLLAEREREKSRAASKSKHYFCLCFFFTFACFVSSRTKTVPTRSIYSIDATDRSFTRRKFTIKTFGSKNFVVSI